MTLALVEPTKLKVCLTILGEGALFFVVLMIGTIIPWFGKPISTKRYIAICGFTVILVAIALTFAIRA